jgi:hypothetical protein
MKGEDPRAISTGFAGIPERRETTFPGWLLAFTLVGLFQSVPLARLGFEAADLAVHPPVKPALTCLTGLVVILPLFWSFSLGTYFFALQLWDTQPGQTNRSSKRDAYLMMLAALLLLGLPKLIAACRVSFMLPLPGLTALALALIYPLFLCEVAYARCPASEEKPESGTQSRSFLVGNFTAAILAQLLWILINPQSLWGITDFVSPGIALRTAVFAVMLLLAIAYLRLSPKLARLRRQAGAGPAVLT